MPPLLPKLRGNELWQQHERDRKYAIHRQRVLKPIQGVDNTTPASCAFTRHIGTPPRTRRDKEVERENEHIVHRMIRIMESPSCIDNHGPPKDERRLVYAQRARDFDQKRIAYENAQLLKRLERTRPTYRTAKYEADRRRNEALAERISRYPYQPMDQRSCGMHSRMNPEPC